LAHCVQLYIAEDEEPPFTVTGSLIVAIITASFFSMKFIFTGAGSTFYCTTGVYVAIQHESLTLTYGVLD